MLIPSAGTNNLWYDYHADSDTVLVFVHGILSDSRGAWLNTGPPEVYWPELLKSDLRIGTISTYLAGYETGLNAGAYNVADCAAEVLKGLKLPSADGKPPILSKPRLVFVCHSMGGIVVRDMLSTYPKEFQGKAIGLVLIASPSYGSQQADRLNWAIKVYGNEQARGLLWGNWRLEELDRKFSLLLADEKRGFTLKGIEAVEQHYVIRPKSKFLPRFFGEQVVPRESGARYFRPGEMMGGTDHFSIARPYSMDHPTHRLLVGFLLDFAMIGLPSSSSPLDTELNPLLTIELEKQLLGLRDVLTKQLPDQLRQGVVDPSKWTGAHDADAWLSANRFQYPPVIVMAFEELLRWFMITLNEFIEWMRNTVSSVGRSNEQANNELRNRIEELWHLYDKKAFVIRQMASSINEI